MELAEREGPDEFVPLLRLYTDVNSHTALAERALEWDGLSVDNSPTVLCYRPPNL